MKRKIGIVILGIIIVIGGYLIYDQMRFKSDDIILELNDVKVIEYGESFGPLTLIKKCSGEVIYQESIDTTKIGKHKITFVVKENQVTKEFAFEIEVRDTKAPDITLTKEKDSIDLGSQLNITQYIKSVKDNADGDLTYKKDKDVKSGDVGFYTYHSQVDTQKNGKYIVTIIAIDKSGNEAKKELAITVQKKKETVSNQQRNQSSPQQYKANPNNKIIVIDPGHQGKGNSEKEAIGPGSSTKKAKVTTGTTGVSSRKAESQINLEIGLKLRTELQSRGYTVIMTRTTQNVNLSNQQRSEIGNSVRGAHTISPAKNNPYCSEIFKASSKLAQSVIQSYSAATGIKSRGVSYRNDLTGINWSQVPSIYIEMGFISNVSEDKLLADSSFQNKCAKGIADGIDKYFQ